jgi:hypothetical protein
MLFVRDFDAPDTPGVVLRESSYSYMPYKLVNCTFTENTTATIGTRELESNYATFRVPSQGNDEETINNVVNDAEIGYLFLRVDKFPPEGINVRNIWGSNSYEAVKDFIRNLDSYGMGKLYTVTAIYKSRMVTKPHWKFEGVLNV